MARNLIQEIAEKSKLKEEGIRVTLSRIKRREDLRSIEQAACYYIKKNNLNINVSSIMDDVTRSAVQKFKSKSVAQPNESFVSSIRKTRPNAKQSTDRKRLRSVSPDLTFVKNAELRSMLQRDIIELNIAISAGVEKTSKTCMILAGSIAETLLLEQLMREQSQALSVGQVLKLKHFQDLEKWKLGDMVEVASHMKPPLLPADLTALADQVREWRNLIHPGRELRDARNKQIEVSKGRANAAISVLQIIQEHLGK